ncbi:MAG: DUF4998 domain-containing protein [Prevotellaceae bacterium]|jgi:hypothetical protein|nr:DUF4998 domain-containing protein [Prevotellaceae bacterium]
MKKIILLLFAAGLAALATSCTPMDENHRKYVEDGPVSYLAKMIPDEITIIGERNKALVELPPMTDPRAKTVKVYWANKTQVLEKPVNAAGATSFLIENLEEGTYIFEFVLHDDAGNKSLTAPVTAEVYGAVYESYLMTRAIMDYNSDDPRKPTITFSEVKDTSMYETVIEWSENGTRKSLRADTAKRVTLDNFNAHSFRYRSVYRPGRTDFFHSPYTYVMNTPKADDIEYDRTGKKFTFPDLSSDDNWVGYEMLWTDRLTFDSKSFSNTSRTSAYTISGYESAEFAYSALFRYDGVQVFSEVALKPTSSRNTFDRSSWRVPLETRADNGEEFDNVMSGPGTAAAAAISAKNKSPYLSHKLPWAAAATDGLNSPRAHIDGDYTTYLSMVKGPGTAFGSDGGAHSNGGVSSNDADFGTEIYFIVDLGREEEFDYFRIVYRLNGSLGAALKPQKISLFGSNDPACIADQSKWTAIRESIEMPNSGSDSSAGNPDAATSSSGNVLVPLSSYRYVKCRYDAWQQNSNTMQISEFFLGGTVY